MLTRKGGGKFPCRKTAQNVVRQVYMFTAGRPTTLLGSVFVTLNLIFEAAVREQRKGHRNALLGLFLNIATTVAFIIAFQIMFSVLGLRGSPLR